jgi:acetyl-CoA carboxylase biotin carboxyl carrier protein
MNIDIEEIKELIRAVNEHGIAELEVQRGGDRVTIRRHAAHTAPELAPSPISHTHTHQHPMAPPPVPIEAPAKPHAHVAPVEDDTALPVKSPIVGTYYDSPSPGAPPFVKVGDRVEPRQVLCIIESMKLMNEIEAEAAGTVVAKLVEDGRPVEYGQPLFTIRPH